MGYRTIGSATVKAKPSVRRPIMDAGVRKEISDTRQRNACIRCRMQKLKCAPDPKNRHDRCLECSQAANSIYRQLPCLRYKIPDTPLFRHAMYNSPFYLDHPLLGDRYGDFHLQKTWVSSRTKTLSALHHGGLRLEVEVRQYLPPGEEDATDDRSMHGLAARPMYTIPWAVADADIETRNLGTVVDRYIESYVVNLLKPGDDLVWPVYQEALRLMPVVKTDIIHQSDLMLDTMRLWVGARLADRGWRCTGSDKLGAETLENQLRPPDWTPLPPYLDYQLVSIIMHRYLSPLRKKVLDRLQTIVRANKPSNWYAIFLTCFVLLHSCEMSIVIVRKHAAKRKSPDRYIIMNLVRALNTSAKVLLAHFHYCCKGNVPFSKSFDWSSPVMRRMAALDPEQSAFMSKYVSVVHEREDIFEAVRKTDHYEAPYWFVCQLFEENWEPRVTHEHSPTSDEAYISGSDHVVTEKGKTVQFGPYHRPDIEEDMSKRPNRGG
ncbi:hypothetical protein B0T16DRAFT_332374 [Cercophora newfieldiana]|uniref:Zn(2)-C6 fungal-type domain-containing protein n=1 Tax=Cercophora newfieldiana TaxID=92897 RepID=A0AA39Y3W5_9PEZI|nr:hypothetical protein B0T16DRAFT_332374 [Cercophora newfieldiana]